MSDHYKYMPPGSVPEEERKDGGGETVVPPVEIEETVVEEVVIMEAPAAGESVTPEASSFSVEDVVSETGEAPLPVKLLYAFFSPVLVPTFISLFIFLLSMLVLVVPEAVAPYTLTVFGATCLVPVLSFAVLRRVGGIKSYWLFSSGERIVPYVVEIMALGGTTLFFIFKGANAWIWTIFCGATAVALVDFILNFRMRVSTHSSAMAALVAALIVINNYGMPQHSLFWWVVGAVVFAGYVGTVAILYGKHTIWEVLTGYAVGFLGVMLFSLIK